MGVVAGKPAIGPYRAKAPRAFVVLLLGLLILVSPSGAAAAFKPTRFDDPRPNGCDPTNCSLREAVIAANKHAGADTIRLGKGAYELTREESAGDLNNSRSGDLDVLDGAKFLGTGKTRIDGAQSSSIGRVFHLQGSLNAYVFRKLTVRRGNAGSLGGGGGILAENIGGSLSLARVKVVANDSGTFGGGIVSHATELRIKKSTIADNHADQRAGGILLPATGGLGPVNATIRSSTISGNVAVSDGGGLLADGTDIGGFPNPPQVTMVNSTVALNEASQSGGGVRAVAGGAITLDNVTVAHNQAERDGAGAGTGGGLSAGLASPFTLGDVLVAGNTVGATGNGSQCAGAFTGQGGNVVQLQAGTACAITGGLSEPVDALIGPLANNGGGTKTVAVLDGSAAIGFAESCPAKDQRGIARPATDCDSGAFEHQGP